MPEGWTWCRLGNIGKWQSGTTPNKKNLDYYKNGTIPWLLTGDLNDGLVTEIPNCITEKALKETSLKINPIGSVCIAMYGATIGKLGILNTPATTNQACCVCYEFYGINNKYLFYFLKEYKEEFIQQGFGGAQPNISKEKIVDTFIPLPPLSEQECIVKSIETYFEQIDSLEENKYDLQTAIKQAKSKILDLAIHGKLVPQNPNDEPAEELLKRIATSDNRPYEKIEEEPFEIPDSWKWVKLNDLAEIARGGSPRPIQDYITDNQDGINWIKIGDTSEESKYITSAKEKIKPEGKKHSRFVHAGDFLLTNSMSFGRPYILKIDGCIHDGWLVFANIKECLLQDYLYYALSSAYIYETFSNVAAGSTVKNLKSDTVKQVNFPLPPLPEQQRIIEAIENMYEVLDQIQNNLV